MNAKVVGVAAALIAMLSACESGGGGAGASATPRLSPSPETSFAQCELPPPKEFRGVVVEAVCPESEELPVGTAQRLELFSLGKGICYRPPDFAGSFWLLVRRPDVLAHGGHGTTYKGEMTRTGEESAVFKGQMSMAGEDHLVRLRFERVRGGWYPGGCE